MIGLEAVWYLGRGFIKSLDEQERSNEKLAQASVKEYLRAFSKVVGYYQSSVANFSVITAPLTGVNTPW